MGQPTQQGDATARQNGEDLTHSGSNLYARVFSATCAPGSDPPHFIACCCFAIIVDESRSGPLFICTLLYFYAFSWPRPKLVDDAVAKCAICAVDRNEIRAGILNIKAGNRFCRAPSRSAPTDS